MGERRADRLQRGCADAGGVQRHAVGAAGQERARGGGVPLQRWLVPGRPGHVPHERHLPRRLPVGGAGAARAGLRGEDGSRCEVPGRDVDGEGRPGQRGEGGGRGDAQRGTARPGGRGGGWRSRPGAARGRRQRAGVVPDRRAQSAQVVRRNAGALPVADDALRREGPRAGGDPVHGGLPRGGDRERAAARQRAPDPDQGRQPPRARRRVGPLARSRRDGARHRADEAAQRERRSHVALPERPALVRPGRPVRPVSLRRSEHRVPRLRHGSEEPADQRPGVDAGLRGPHAADGRARQEPPVDHRLVDGERVRRRPQLLGDLQVDQGPRPFAPRALRGQLEPPRAELRHRVLHVPDADGAGPPGDAERRQAVDSLRIHARDGQQQRRVEGVPGTCSTPVPTCRGRSCGTG